MLYLPMYNYVAQHDTCIHMVVSSTVGLIIGVTTGTNLVILLVVVIMMTVFYRWKYQKNNNPERYSER